MSGGSLLLLMLLVSWTSLMLQGAAAVHLWRQRNEPGKLAGHGYARTAACRVLAAVIYVTVALLQVLNVRVPGAGSLSPEALVVFTAVQFIWIVNSAMDIRVRRRLTRGGDSLRRDKRYHGAGAVTEHNPRYHHAAADLVRPRECSPFSWPLNRPRPQRVAGLGVGQLNCIRVKAWFLRSHGLASWVHRARYDLPLPVRISISCWPPGSSLASRSRPFE